VSRIFEKSGTWSGSVLWWANGLEAGRDADAADLAAGAAMAGPVATAIAAVARKMLRIMRVLLVVIFSVEVCSTVSFVYLV
jgi:hypothetical protein